MAVEEEQGGSQPGPSPRPDASQPGSSTVDKPPSLTRHDSINNVASRVASEPLQDLEPSVWAVITAINTKARERKQGLNMPLKANTHYIGRRVKDTLFRIGSNVVSREHCRIFKKEATAGVFLKDTSSNGTFINWTKLGKHSGEAEIHHGDIISFVAAPHSDHAYAFVFREVVKSTPATGGTVTKRKANELGSQKKRVKGIGLGAPEGPVSLDDFRSLQRSNTELREQLEKQVLTIDALRQEHRSSLEHHDKEMKDLKDSISNSYLNQIKELQDMLDHKQKELVELSKLSVEQKQEIEDLNARLSSGEAYCEELKRESDRLKQISDTSAQRQHLEASLVKKMENNFPVPVVNTNGPDQQLESLMGNMELNPPFPVNNNNGPEDQLLDVNCMLPVITDAPNQKVGSSAGNMESGEFPLNADIGPEPELEP